MSLRDRTPEQTGVGRGFQMIEQALAWLASIDNTLKQLVQVTRDRMRNSIGEGALAFSIVVGVNGITQTGWNSPYVLDANPMRRGATFTNTSAAGGPTISLGLGQTSPTAGAGIVLPPGASWDGRIGNLVWSGSVAARASGAGATLAVIEG